MQQHIIEQWNKWKQRLANVLQFVGNLLLVIGDKLDRFFFTCEKCVSLENTLRYEREQKGFFQDLLLRRTGDILNREILKVDDEITTDNVPVRRGRTLSSIRRQAEEHIALKHRTAQAVPATLGDLTEAEKIFQSELEERKH